MTGFSAVLDVPADYPTIQAAVDAAPDGSVIQIAAGVYTEELRFISLNKNIYIRGLGGASQTVLNGGGTRAYLYILNGGQDNPALNVVFDGITFENGQGSGGTSPITIERARPGFMNCVFRNNRAPIKGGAVVAYGLAAHPFFVDCLFENNRSDGTAGAVLVNEEQSQAAFWNCRFINNSNRTGAAPGHAEGGAVYFANAGGTIVGCNFEGNSTMYAGGAIMSLTWWDQPADLVEIHSSRFSGNFAHDLPGIPAPATTEGGAVMAENNVLVRITDSEFFDNHAEAGGGVHAYRAALDISGCVFEGNDATGTDHIGYGGAIGVNNNDAGDPIDHPEGSLVIRDTFIGDSVSPVGGGIFYTGDDSHNKLGSVTLEDVIVDSCTATTSGNSYGNGGGIYADKAIVDARDVMVVNNTAGFVGGGFVITRGTVLNLHDCTVAGNNANFDDAIHDIDESVSVLDNTLFAYNGGYPAVDAAVLMAAPGTPRYGGTVGLAYFAAPFSPGVSLDPLPGALPDRGAYAAGGAVITGLTETATFTLHSSHPDRAATAVVDTAGPAFGGTLAQLPGIVEIENFDQAPVGQAYFDRTSPNEGGHYRTGESLDIAYSSGRGNDHVVGWTVCGEWMEYTVMVNTSATYRLKVHVAAPDDAGSFYVAVDGSDVTGVQTVSATGGWGAWGTTSPVVVPLTAGRHVIRFVIVSGGFNLDYMQWTAIPPIPELAVDPGTLSIVVKQGLSVPRDLTVWNAGLGSLSYELTNDAPWLALSDTNGVSAGERDTITLTVDSSGLSTGSYNSAVTILAPGVSNAPQSVLVSLEVVEDRDSVLDFDGDGVSDIGHYSPGSGSWAIMQSSAGLFETTFGYAGTVPITGDFDGDGRADFGCYYAPGGNWYIYQSTAGFYATTFGYAGTVPIVGDFDGDGRDDFGCYYAPGGNWYMYRSTAGFYATTFGYAGTVPIVGDFDGDGRDDFGCHYAPGGNWYVYRSSEGLYTTVFGHAGTIALGSR